MQHLGGHLQDKEANICGDTYSSNDFTGLDWKATAARLFKQQSLVRNLAGEEAQWQHTYLVCPLGLSPSTTYNIPPSNTGQN